MARWSLVLIGTESLPATKWSAARISGLRKGRQSNLRARWRRAQSNALYHPPRTPPTNLSVQLYAQNLSLFAKLFLDTKSVFYDVTTFRYYLLVQTESSTSARQVVGFFSKEKMSWDNNNVACILVFPPWQRKGLGQILMGVSYELSRREGRLGGPEKRT